MDNWISVGVHKGADSLEAVETFLGRRTKVTGTNKITDGTFQVHTQSDGSFDCHFWKVGEWLLFRLVGSFDSGVAAYVPSAKPPRKQRSDVGKKRKSSVIAGVGTFEVVTGEIPDAIDGV